jgi:RHS repeat-associated protein
MKALRLIAVLALLGAARTLEAAPLVAFVSPAAGTVLEAGSPFELRIDYSAPGSSVRLSTMQILVNGQDWSRYFTKTPGSAILQMEEGHKLPGGTLTVAITVEDQAGATASTNATYRVVPRIKAFPTAVTPGQSFEALVYGLDPTPANNKFHFRSSAGQSTFVPASSVDLANGSATAQAPPPPFEGTVDVVVNDESTEQTLPVEIVTPPGGITVTPGLPSPALALDAHLDQPLRFDYSATSGVIDPATVHIAFGDQDWTARFTRSSTQATYILTPAERLPAGVGYTIRAIVGGASASGLIRFRPFYVSPPQNAVAGQLATFEVAGLDPVAANNVAVFSASMGAGKVAASFASVNIATGTGTVIVPAEAVSGPTWIRVNGMEAIDSRHVSVQHDDVPVCEVAPVAYRFLASGALIAGYRTDSRYGTSGSEMFDQVSPRCPDFPPTVDYCFSYGCRDGGGYRLVLFPPGGERGMLLRAEQFDFYSTYLQDEKPGVFVAKDGFHFAYSKYNPQNLSAGGTFFFDGKAFPIAYNQNLSLLNNGDLGDMDTLFVASAGIRRVTLSTGQSSQIAYRPNSTGYASVVVGCDNFLYASWSGKVNWPWEQNPPTHGLSKLDPDTGEVLAEAEVRPGNGGWPMVINCAANTILVASRRGEGEDFTGVLEAIDTATFWVTELATFDRAEITGIALAPEGTVHLTLKEILPLPGSPGHWVARRWMDKLPYLPFPPACGALCRPGETCTSAIPYCPWLKFDKGEQPGNPTDVAEEVPEKTEPAEPRTEDPKAKPCEESVPNPVSTMTGAMYLSQTDGVLKGIRRSLPFTRSYNSQRARAGKTGVFGFGWEWSLDKKLTKSRGLLRLNTGNGSPIYFRDADGDLTWSPYLPIGEKSTIVEGASGFTRTFYAGGSELYDAEGLLVSQADRMGNVTSMARDGQGHLTSVTAPGGRAFHLGYADGRVASLSGPSGPIATYVYADGLLQQVTYADGRGLAFTYDSRGQLLQLADQTGRIIETHTYDDYGRALTSEVADGVGRYTLAYDQGPFSATRVTTATGEVTEYTSKLIAGLPTLVRIDGLCACTNGAEFKEWTFDTATGLVTSVRTGLADNPTQYTYDGEKNVLTRTDPLGRITRFTYDNLGRVLTVTAPDTGVSTMTYGPAGIATIKDPLNRTTTFGYSAAGLLNSVTDPRGKTTTLVYGAMGDLSSMTDPLNHGATFSYDASGRLLSFVDALGRATTLTRNTLGRISKVEKPDGKAIELTYDASGRRTALKDEKARISRTAYDLYGRVVATTDSLGQVTSYAYDSMSRMAALTDAKGQTTRFEYDASGRLKSTRQPDGKEVVLQYDEKGRIKERADQSGRVTTFAYDSVSRPTAVRMTGGVEFVYTYDQMNRIETTANGTDTLSWAYNLAGEVVSESSARNQSVVSYSYDGNGGRSSLALNGATFASYTQDDASRLTSITRGGNVFGFSYDAVNRRTALSQPNGVNTTYSYDNSSRLTGIQAVKNAATISTLTYGYDDVGNRTFKSVGDHLENYGYDDLDRLAGVSRTGAGENEWRFRYDAVGNRTTTQVGTGEVVTPVFNSRNQMLQQVVGGALMVEGTLNEEASVSVNGSPARMVTPTHFEATIQSVAGTNAFTVAATDVSGNVRTDDYEVQVNGTAASYGYDAAGNLVSKVLPGETWTYTWNALNQLMSASKNGVVQASFQYDPLGRRVTKSTPTKVTAYTYDAADILREDVKVGAITTTSYYVHGPSVDEPLSKETDGVPTYYHADALGSIVRETNAGGVVTNTLHYDAWGNIEAGARDGFAFTGREWDPETGLYLYRARYYDARLGRFVSEDPAGLSAGVNLLEYVSGNPIVRRDPTGLDWLDDLGTLSAGFADNITFGVTRQIRRHNGTDQFVDNCSGWYTAGHAAGTAWWAAAGAAAGTRLSLATGGDAQLYMQSPLLYEAGTMSVSNQLYAELGLGAMNAVQKGQTLIGHYGGYGGFLRASLSNFWRAAPNMLSGPTPGGGAAAGELIGAFTGGFSAGAQACQCNR